MRSPVETGYLLDSKRRAESFVFRNTRSIKQVWVKNDPHDLVPESDEIQEGIKMIHADRACEPKSFVFEPAEAYSEGLEKSIDGLRNGKRFLDSLPCQIPKNGLASTVRLWWYN